MASPFVFYTQQQLVVLTGRRARNLEELLHHLREVPGASIFYHTHYRYLTQHFAQPRFFNAFADWINHALQERRLAERLGAIDLLSVTSIRELRETIADLIDAHIQEPGAAIRNSPPGDEFHFCEAKSFVFPTGLVARDASEFLDMVPLASNASVHFHIFESRIRLERPANDFSTWLDDLGESRLARAIDKLNPYTVSLDELKLQIRRVGRRYVRRTA